MQNGTLKDLTLEIKNVGAKIDNIETAILTKDALDAKALAVNKNSLATWSLRIAIVAVILSCAINVVPYVTAFFKFLSTLQ